MNTKSFAIDERLLADSHTLFSWNQCQIRLHKNASLPWVMVIPQTDLIEYFDLPTELQSEISQIAKRFGDYFKEQLGSEKINFAAIGNVVQQLHVHVIGRHSGDPLWPDVVWGNTLSEKKYTRDQLLKIKSDLLKLLGHPE